MPRVHFVQKARKDNPVCKAGESYYWWKFNYGPKRYSKTPPKRSQLTRSDFLSQMYDIEDEVLGKATDCTSTDDLQGVIDDAISQLDDLSFEQDDKFQNMPESLQYGTTGELLEERSQGCQDMISELESIDLDNCDSDEDEDAWLQGKADEVAQVCYQGG